MDSKTLTIKNYNNILGYNNGYDILAITEKANEYIFHCKHVNGAHGDVRLSRLGKETSEGEIVFWFLEAGGSVTAKWFSNMDNAWCVIKESIESVCFSPF